VQARSGLLFTPSDWRGRASLTWSGGPLTLNGSLNYIGGVDDTRTVPAIRVRGMTTFDVTARYRLKPARGAVHGLDLTLSLLNAFDQPPDQIATRFYFDTAYDSTNYSPVGRVVVFGIATSW
jgi:hypothetical protein